MQAFALFRLPHEDKIYFIKTELVIYTIGIVSTWILTGLWHGANFTFII